MDILNTWTKYGFVRQSKRALRCTISVKCDMVCTYERKVELSLCTVLVNLGYLTSTSVCAFYVKKIITSKNRKCHFLILHLEWSHKWWIKGVWFSRVPLGTRENQPPLSTMSGFSSNKRLKSHFLFLEVVIFFQKGPFNLLILIKT